MPIRVIAVGKKHESWVNEGIDRYEKRLKKPFTVEWVFLPHSAREGVAARQEESERILSRLSDNEYVILLDERGKVLDSPALSRLLLVPLESSTNVTIIIGGAYGVAARQEESERILSRLSDNEYVILLDERGKVLDSPALSRLLLAPLESSTNVTIIIGGAYGVDESVHRRANVVWSLSLLVFPHQLVRLILAEQLYRAQEIAAGGPYHHL